MACSSCGTGGCSTGGCGKKGGCSTGSCNKLNSFDWLGVMEMDESDRFDLVEVRFKGGRKEYFKNPSHLDLYTGDLVVIEAASGYHIGEVTLQGELVRLQLKKKEQTLESVTASILRKANTKDTEKFEQAKAREISTMYRTREISQQLKLGMKLSDVEYQADNTKATFYYSADDRVDFRELIKLLASEFKIRVEMKQISLRQEASRLGGIGSCGRELCCSTWLSDFKNVNTSAARYQNLALNPSKLSGQCGRLKCCLNYELDTYMEALKDFPEVEKPLLTEKGDAVLLKTDIFKRTMWFAYRNDESTWIALSVERVQEIMTMNSSNTRPATLEHNTDDGVEEKAEMLKEIKELSRFDDKFKSKKKKKNKNRNKNKSNPNNTNAGPQNTGSTTPPQNSAPKEQSTQIKRQNVQPGPNRQNNPNNQNTNTGNQNRGDKQKPQGNQSQQNHPKKNHSDNQRRNNQGPRNDQNNNQKPE